MKNQTLSPELSKVIEYSTLQNELFDICSKYKLNLLKNITNDNDTKKLIKELQHIDSLVTVIKNV